jgi:hypothetical protein
VQSGKLFVTLAHLGISGMFRQLAAVLLALTMKGQVFFAHGQLQQLKRRQLSLPLAPCLPLGAGKALLP